MLLEITDLERQFLVEVVEAASKTMLHEIDHTDSREYRKRLQHRMTILEHISKKINEPHEAHQAHII
jgi:hypothetical protein